VSAAHFLKSVSKSERSADFPQCVCAPGIVPCGRTHSTEKQLRAAKRWANRIPKERTKAGKQSCIRRCLDALYSILPPKADGSHPLHTLKLRGG
jgi:hypothetical protein